MDRWSDFISHSTGMQKSVKKKTLHMWKVQITATVQAINMYEVTINNTQIRKACWNTLEETLQIHQFRMLYVKYRQLNATEKV
jgi:hypothetical protein